MEIIHRRQPISTQHTIPKTRTTKHPDTTARVDWTTWWLWRGAPTRSHPELGRENPQRPWYCVLRHGRVGRRQVFQSTQTKPSDKPRDKILTPAGWSSPVARQAHNLKVTGSNPVPATNFIKRPNISRSTAVIPRLICVLRAKIRRARLIIACRTASPSNSCVSRVGDLAFPKREAHAHDDESRCQDQAQHPIGDAGGQVVAQDDARNGPTHRR